MRKQIIVCDCCKADLSKDVFFSLTASQSRESKEYDFCENCVHALTQLKPIIRAESFAALELDYENLLYAARGVSRMKHESPDGDFRKEIERLQEKVRVIDQKLKEPREITKHVAESRLLAGEFNTIRRALFDLLVIDSVFIAGDSPTDEELITAANNHISAMARSAPMSDLDKANMKHASQITEE